jgi:hypothetical protein
VKNASSRLIFVTLFNILVLPSAFAADVSDSCKETVRTKIIQSGHIPAGSIQVVLDSKAKAFIADFACDQAGESNVVEVSISSSVCSSNPTGRERATVVEVESATDFKGAFHYLTQ